MTKKGKKTWGFIDHETLARRSDAQQPLLSEVK